MKKKFEKMASGGKANTATTKALTSQRLGDADETRKLLVSNIAASIFESLKQNSDMKEILKELILGDEEKKRKRLEPLWISWAVSMLPKLYFMMENALA